MGQNYVQFVYLTFVASPAILFVYCIKSLTRVDRKSMKVATASDPV
jgi:hypothetical protein